RLICAKPDHLAACREIDPPPHREYGRQRAWDIGRPYGSLARGPRVVPYTLLRDPEVPASGPCQELGVHEEVVAFNGDLLYQFAPHELEGAVDVADVQPKKHSDQPVVKPRQDAP